MTAGLKASANVGYTDAYYPNAAYGAPSNGATPLLNGAGDKLMNVQPWTASAHLDYSRDIGQLGEASRGYFRVDYRWLDAAPKLNPAIANYDPTVGPQQNAAYSMLNLRLGVVHSGLDLSIYVDNATDSNPLLGFNHAGLGDPLLTATAIRPRTFGATGLFHF